jgi:Fic family protein
MFRPLYRYTHELVESLMNVEAARSAIEVLPLPRGSANELREQARRAQAQAAQQLDGAANSAYSGGLSQIAGKSAESPDEDALFALYAILAGQASNGFRTNSSLVYNQARTDLIYVPPEAREVAGLTSDLLDWLDQSWEVLPAVALSAVCQQELLMIQPFEHANGAVARAAGELVLLRKGYGFDGYLAIGPELVKRADWYEEATRSTHSGVYSRQSDFTNWIEFYAEVLDVAASQARDEVVARFEAANRPQLEGAPQTAVILRDRHRQALDYMRKNGAIRSGEYQKLARIVPDTARRDFDELMDKGLIAVRGVGRGTHYVLTQRGSEEAERRSGD